MSHKMERVHLIWYRNVHIQVDICSKAKRYPLIVTNVQNKRNKTKVASS